MDDPSLAPQMFYRKKQPPSAAEVLAEAKELLRYEPEKGLIWVKIRGRVPHKLIGNIAGGESGRVVSQFECNCLKNNSA